MALLRCSYPVCGFACGYTPLDASVEVLAARTAPSASTIIDYTAMPEGSTSPASVHTSVPPPGLPLPGSENINTKIPIVSSDAPSLTLLGACTESELNLTKTMLKT